MSICVFQVNGLGDMVATLPLLKGLREVLPEEPIHLVCSHLGEQIVKPLGLVDGFLCFDVDSYKYLWRNPLKLFHAIRIVRGWKCRLSIATDDDCTTTAILAWLAGIPSRIGSDFHDNKGSRFYTHRLEIDRTRHVIQNRFEAVRYVQAAVESGNEKLKGSQGGGILPPHIQLAPVCLSYSLQGRARVAEIKKELGVSRLLVVHPFAKYANREWPLKRYVEVTNQLVAGNSGLGVVFLTNRPVRELGGAARVLALENPLLNELVAFISEADLFLGNNSGPMNVAVNQGTPVICLNGPTASWWKIDPWPGRTPVVMLNAVNDCVECEAQPVQTYGSCFNAEFGACMNSISVDRVVEACCRLLSH